MALSELAALSHFLKICLHLNIRHSSFIHSPSSYAFCVCSGRGGYRIGSIMRRHFARNRREMIKDAFSFARTPMTGSSVSSNARWVLGDLSLQPRGVL